MIALQVAARRAPQARKHKTWEGDGVLVVNGTRGTLLDLDGKLYAHLYDLLIFLTRKLPRLTTGKVSQPIADGAEFPFSNKELGIDRPISRAEYMSGACFGRNAIGGEPAPLTNSGGLAKKFVPLRPVTTNPSRPAISAPASSSKDASNRENILQSSWTVNW